MIHNLTTAFLHAPLLALSMGWDILWALILGFMLSGAVQAVVTKGEMGRHSCCGRLRTPGLHPLPRQYANNIRA